MNLTRAIVVVDGRTCRGALRKIQALSDLERYTQAKSGAVAARIWLKDELRTGPLWARVPVLSWIEQRRRVRYASYLERVELLEQELNKHLGFPA